jgi:hypothetical protein
MIKKFETYECAYRFFGRCPGCSKNYENLDCEYYYPLHSSLGGGIVPSPDVARILIAEFKRERDSLIERILTLAD